VSTWFPKTNSIEDIYIFDRGLFSKEDIVQILNDIHAVEWHDKVGVAGNVDGSAKTTTRLLHSLNCVFKTDTHLCVKSFEECKQFAIDKISIQKKIPIWVYGKTWFILKNETGYWPISITPKLKTIRKISLFNRLTCWEEMLKITLSVWKQYHILLDFNPSNFGFLPENSSKMFYIDDEIFFRADFDLLSIGIHQRLKEVEDELELCYEWGRIVLNNCLQFLDHTLLEKLIDLLKSPILKINEPAFLQFLLGLTKIDSIKLKDKSEDTKHHSESEEFTCFFADVHANFEAFKEMLKDMSEFNVTSFVFLGDIVGYGPRPSECIELLKNIPNLTFIQGNHDFWVAENNWPADNKNLCLNMEITKSKLSSDQIEFLKNMPHDFKPNPQTKYIHGSILHAHLRFGYIYEMTYKDNLEKIDELDISYLWYAHSHLANVYAMNEYKNTYRMGPYSTILKKNYRYLINPGSIGQPRDADNRGSYCLYNQNSGKLIFRRFEYDIQKVAQEILDEGLPADYAQRLFKGF